MRNVALVIGVALATSGCLGQSGPAAAQEAARELNTNLRFGRMELVIERVSPGERSAYVAQHRNWGGAIRIADSEMDGMSLLSKEEALVMVKVAWYEPTAQELRVTTLRQTWKKEKDNWLLTAEARADGDLGLLGEAIPAAPKPDPNERRPPAQFQTVRIAD